MVLTLASQLSGTYQSAVIAASDYPDSIYVVDSSSVAIGAGILAELALRLRDQGLSAAEIARQLEEQKRAFLPFPVFAASSFPHCWR